MVQKGNFGAPVQARRPGAEIVFEPMEVTISTARERVSAVRRAGRIFVNQLHGRSTLIIALLVGTLLCAALAAVRSGVSLGDITGAETTDDAYVRADQVAISSHIAGYVESIPVSDNQMVRQGQLIAIKIGRAHV